MEIADIVRWICLAFSFIAALFSVIIYVSFRNPQKYVIESNETFVTNLYKEFAGRLISDPQFVVKAKEAVGMGA